MDYDFGSKAFGEWLMGQRKRKDGVGELARLAKRHKYFRRDMTYQEFREVIPMPESYVSEDWLWNHTPKPPYWQAVLEYGMYRYDRREQWRSLASMPNRRRRRKPKRP